MLELITKLNVLCFFSPLNFLAKYLYCPKTSGSYFPDAHIVIILFIFLTHLLALRVTLFGSTLQSPSSRMGCNLS